MTQNLSTVVSRPAALTDLFGHLGGGLDGDLGAALPRHLLTGLLGHLGAVLPGHLSAGLLGHLNRHLLAVLLGHLGALLGRLLDGDLLAALAGDLLALLAVSTIPPVSSGADLLVGGGALLLVPRLVHRAALLLVGGGALGLVAGLIRGAALLLIGGLVSSLVHCPAFWCVTSLNPGGQGDTGDHKQLSVHVELESL